VLRKTWGIRFDNCSGHYLPDIECLTDVLKPLADKLDTYVEYADDDDDICR